MRAVQEAERIGLSITSKGKIFATPFFSGITGAAIVERKWQAAGVAAGIAGAFFVADKGSNKRKNLAIGEQGLEAGRQYEAGSMRAKHLMHQAEIDQRPADGSVDRQQR